jgi:hypothetical protein
MIRRAVHALLVAGAIVLAAESSSAQSLPAYDFGTETTVTGVVKLVFTREAEQGLDLLLLLNVAGEEQQVYVGPVMFVARNNFSYMARDQVTIIGSKVQFEAEPWLLAREITRAGKTLKLRDETGLPVWPAAPSVTRASGCCEHSSDACACCTASGQCAERQHRQA